MKTHSGFTFRSDSVVRFVSAVAGAALALLISSSALAADEAPEVKTAATHAGLAAGAENIEGVRTHLHHTLNCLVGTDGDGFNSDEMNPCADMGKGAIPGTQDKEMKDTLEKAADKVRSGLDTDDYGEAKSAAMTAQRMLKSE